MGKRAAPCCRCVLEMRGIGGTDLLFGEGVLWMRIFFYDGAKDAKAEAKGWRARR